MATRLMAARLKAALPASGRRAALALMLALSCGPLLSALDVPPLSGRVNDYADMISSSAEATMVQKLEQLEASDSTQVAVLTVPSLEGEDLEGFSIRVADAWKIGTAENDNGAILLVARDDRAVRIEVGYGLEGRLTDLLSGRIVDQIIVPNFKAGRFDDGFLQATDAIIGAVKGEYKGTGQLPGARQTGGRSLMPLAVAAVIAAAIGSRRRLFGGIAGGVLAPLASFFLFPAGLLTLLMIPLGFGGGWLLSAMGLFRGGRGGRRGGGFWPGGFGGFGGSSGGFSGGGFSGGGGGFGGGGASGHW
jgi:uncharacterized protein